MRVIGLAVQVVDRLIASVKEQDYGALDGTSPEYQCVNCVSAVRVGHKL